MACAFDDARTIVVAMVDFAISAQFGLIQEVFSLICYTFHFAIKWKL